MIDICHELHQLLNSLPHYHFPFDDSQIPLNGIYIFFEDGEIAHGTNRIVRVGTHTGKDKLPSRLKEHLIKENKDRSIFRKNIGRALLNKEKDPYLEKWNSRLKTHAEKIKFCEKQSRIEQRVSKYMQSHLSFVVVPVLLKEDRLRLESRLISTISLCKGCHPSPHWLGLDSPEAKIRESGLWQVNHLYKQPLTEFEFKKLANLISSIK